MSTNYNYKDFHIRLKQERELRNLTQENVSKFLCVTQGHYCKIEMGYNRLSFKEIIELQKIGINMYYVFTGVRVLDLKYEALLKKYNVIEQMWIYEIVATVVRHNCRSHDLWRRISNTRFILEKNDRKNIWSMLQEHNSLTQAKMAEALKVEVKKYRRLKRREILADSDVILHAYEYFQVSPMFFMEEKDALVHEICMLLNMMDENKRKDIFEYVVLGCSKFLE